MIRIVAVKYTCPRCGRTHEKDTYDDWYELNQRYCVHCGVVMWHEEIKKDIKSDNTDTSATTKG